MVIGQGGVLLLVPWKRLSRQEQEVLPAQDVAWSVSFSHHLSRFARVIIVSYSRPRPEEVDIQDNTIGLHLAAMTTLDRSSATCNGKREI